MNFKDIIIENIPKMSSGDLIEILTSIEEYIRTPEYLFKSDILKIKKTQGSIAAFKHVRENKPEFDFKQCKDFVDNL